MRALYNRIYIYIYKALFPSFPTKNQPVVCLSRPSIEVEEITAVSASESPSSKAFRCCMRSACQTCIAEGAFLKA